MATVLILISLALPATTLAYGVAADEGGPVLMETAGSAPSDDSPCSDEQDSDCCDVSFCNCECHAPIGRGLRLSYAPFVAARIVSETFWLLPQVYRPIFVPPQNLS